jgi:hypothetical protein
VSNLTSEPCAHDCQLHVGELLELANGPNVSRIVDHDRFRRYRASAATGVTVLVDQFGKSAALACFVRIQSLGSGSVTLFIDGSFRLEFCPSGGWLLATAGGSGDSYWFPRPPFLRTTDGDGHVLSESIAKIEGAEIKVDRASVVTRTLPDTLLDWLVWKIPPSEEQVLNELRHLRVLEAQPVFLWGSHTLYQRPADVYLHLVFGHVYENRFLWPYNRKSCSENDAHALYVTLSGLQRATGKKLYAFLKEQLLLSVLVRQSSDGGWHHGEWSEDMEAHLRLNGSAIHLLMDSLDERDDPAVRQALERAVSFVSRHRDETAVGVWFLHDSLELTEAAMKKSPFVWQASRVLGKSASNMLVLNTHLDTLVLMDRYRQVSGDDRYDSLIDSAKNATRAVLNLRPLESVYGFLLRLVRLNLLPLKEQMSLPLPLKALKRIGWQWLRPNFFRLTARFPRLVMPGGYIERAVTLRGMADDYHSINVMDLGRYWRRFPAEKLAPIIRQAVEFIRRNHVDSHWAEDKWKNYALGFWAEAIYHFYLLTGDRETLSYLAESMIKLEEHGIGLPPSLLGANCEAVASRDQVGCPSPTDVNFRVANLSRRGRGEFLVVNSTGTPRQLSWETMAALSLIWENNAGEQIKNSNAIQVPARGWVVGRGDSGKEAEVSAGIASPKEESYYRVSGE